MWAKTRETDCSRDVNNIILFILKTSLKWFLNYWKNLKSVKARCLLSTQRSYHHCSSRQQTTLTIQSLFSTTPLLLLNVFSFPALFSFSYLKTFGKKNETDILWSQNRIYALFTAVSWVGTKWQIFQQPQPDTKHCLRALPVKRCSRLN